MSSRQHGSVCNPCWFEDCAGCHGGGCECSKIHVNQYLERIARNLGSLQSTDIEPPQSWAEVESVILKWRLP